MKKVIGIILGIVLFFCCQSVAYAQFLDETSEPFFDYPSIPPLPPLPPAPPSPLLPPTPTVITGSSVIFVGTPDMTPNELKGYGVSSTDIDAILDPYAPFTGLETSFVTNRANDAFVELAEFKQDMVDNLKTVILDIPEVSKVRWLTIDVNPIDLQFIQEGTHISVEIEGIDTSIGLEVKPTGTAGFFCPTANIKASLSDIRIIIKYDAYQGTVFDTAIDYNIVDRGVDCQGLLPSIAQYLYDIFNRVDGEIDAAIRDGVEDITGSANMETLFSVKDFLDSLREYGILIENEYNNLPDSITIDPIIFDDISSFDTGHGPIVINKPELGIDISDEVNNVIDAAHVVIGGFGGTSVQLDFLLDDSDVNTVSFIASHRPVHITGLEYTQDNILISMSVPANTDRVALFQRASSTSPWHQFATIHGPYFPPDYIAPQYSQGTQFIAIGVNNTIPGLRSLPGRIKTSTWDFTCYGNDPNCVEVY